MDEREIDREIDERDREIEREREREREEGRKNITEYVPESRRSLFVRVAAACDGHN